MKRNRESACRIKLIQENGYTKEEQRILDDILTKQNKRYSTAYAASRTGTHFEIYDLIIALTRASRAMAQVGISADRATDAFCNFAETVKPAMNIQE